MIISFPDPKIGPRDDIQLIPQVGFALREYLVGGML